MCWGELPCPRTTASAPLQLRTLTQVLLTCISAPAGHGVLCGHCRDGRRPSHLLLATGVSEAPIAVSLHPQRWCCLFSGRSGARVPKGPLGEAAGLG